MEDNDRRFTRIVIIVTGIVLVGYFVFMMSYSLEKNQNISADFRIDSKKIAKQEHNAYSGDISGNIYWL